MLIIYFLLGLGVTTAHSDYGVAFRAQNFDKTVQNIDKEAYTKYQREKRFITGYFVLQNVINRPSWRSNSSRDFVPNITRFQYGNRPSVYNGVIPHTDTEEASNTQRVKRLVSGYFVPQNVTNKPTWGNLNITRNHTTFTRSSTSRNLVANEQKYLNNETRPNNQVIVIYPGQPGYVEPFKNTTGFTRITLGPYGNMTEVTGKYINPGQNYNKNATWPVYPTYNYINGNTSKASGYNVPVNSVTHRNMPYPGYPGYPAPNTVYTAQNTGYPAQNTVYTAQNTGYPVQNTGYPAQNTGYPASNPNPGQNYNTTVTRPVNPNYNNINIRPANINYFNNSNPSGYNVQPVNPVIPGNTPYYPVPNSGYPAPNTGYPASNTGYRVPNTGYSASSGYPAPNNGYSASSGYPAPNTGYPPSSVYPVPNTFYPPPSSVTPKTNVTGYVPKPNPGFTIHDAVPRNNSNGFNNTASLANCNIKCNRPRANSTITKEERTMDACVIACNNCPAGMKMSAFGICVEDLDSDDEY